MADRNSNYGSRERGQRHEQWGERNGGYERDEDSNESGRLFRPQDDEPPMYGQYRESDRSRDSDRDYGTYKEPYSQSNNPNRYDYSRGDFNQPGRYGNTGQGLYGQSGYGQGAHYGREAGSSGTSQYGRSDYGRGGGSNYGSGRYSEDENSMRRDRSGSGAQRGTQYSGWREPSGESRQYSGMGYGYDTGRPDQDMGPHRGKGPKGYQRSDERLKEMISERLREDPAIDASEITVIVASGKVTFQGTVDSRRTKNAVEDIAEQLDANEVQNDLRVAKAGSMSSGMGTAGMSSSGGSSGGSRLSNDEESSKQKRN